MYIKTQIIKYVEGKNTAFAVRYGARRTCDIEECASKMVELIRFPHRLLPQRTHHLHWAFVGIQNSLKRP